MFMKLHYLCESKGGCVHDNGHVDQHLEHEAGRAQQLHATTEPKYRRDYLYC